MKEEKNNNKPTNSTATIKKEESNFIKDCKAMQEEIDNCTNNNNDIYHLEKLRNKKNYKVDCNNDKYCHSNEYINNM